MLTKPQQDMKRPIFSGHETFPLRYGWLKKSYNAVLHATMQGFDAKDVFSNEAAISEFGVGKNMVSSMRHWCNMTGILEENQLTDFAHAVFADEGFDPWMEHPMTLWILHYHLSSNPQLVTYYWYFNINNNLNLDRKTFHNEVMEYCLKEGLKPPSPTTLKRDIECLIRLYMFKTTQNNDDAIESPLTELELITPLHKQGYFAANRGAKPTLPTPLFWEAVFRFWASVAESQKTLSLGMLAYQALSPGRLFLLDENSLIERIYDSVASFKGQVEWSETAGLKQLELKGQTTLEALIQMCETQVQDVYRHEI
ncbi:DUF4007 family protein [Wohlfahrtiimonas chitiniclastica]|uniref:DUF4007 family protein n=1 Tax=Wohlfahrtiimonas chitiniclastica TaxID=400946 RepID=A0AB35C3N4_9GAMM|nr:DUF4007 family protein [Wohlfahrtiimonas chitiniclastica]MBS7816698.1 DUF4007 family protein [Wohlfahrtiimonas chitiniclastica]MBS7822409.1 DUF4007 family protein [Wohlfahrtiimonas chitiniclastica]MBS7825123.1 DUF4007 family protein [Wohlfahrtiimonas chitiniclastica]MBS7830471.1 DUF4007 family protein [Wohlfahrtiimonas chitiniclastica]MBS7832439.1 DUF4007 family protein [Wohlfahrtiimonas chitiniclastica]